MTNTIISPLVATQSLEKGWTHIDLISCTQCLEHTSVHMNEMLMCLFNATGTPKKDFIYKQVVKIINETLGDDEQQAKEIRRQVRKLINEHFIETAQHVCLSRKNKLALQSIAQELSLLPELFSMNKETGIALFDQLERFVDLCGQVELSEYGRRAIQSSERNSSVMLRGRNLYALDKAKNTVEVRLQIENFYSSISIGICSDNVSPNDIEQALNTFPIDPSLTTREGDVFNLSIDVNEYVIHLWNSYRSKKYRNSEQHKRQRNISKRKCPLPWRFFVILTGKDNHVRIVY